MVFHSYRLAEGSKPKIFEESSEDEDEKETVEERGKRLCSMRYVVETRITCLINELLISIIEISIISFSLLWTDEV